MSSRKIVETKILELKAEGKSLREIASILGISHEGVRKRLKSLEAKEKELTVPNKEKEKVSTGSKPRKSRASEELGDTVNRVSTSNAPCPTLTEGVNPLGTPSGKLPEHPEWVKGVSQGVYPESGDLFEGIKDFLEAKGVEIYRMQVSQEAYQVTNGTQVIRFYLSHRNKVA